MPHDQITLPGKPVSDHNTTSPAVVARYQKRISGPLFDRMDIHVECRASTRQLDLSAPAYHSVVKLTLTIFDLVDVLGFGLAYPA